MSIDRNAPRTPPAPLVPPKPAEPPMVGGEALLQPVKELADWTDILPAPIHRAATWYRGDGQATGRFNWRKARPAYNLLCAWAAWSIPLPFVWTWCHSLTTAVVALWNPMGGPIPLPNHGAEAGWIPAAHQVPNIALNIYLNPGSAIIALVALIAVCGGVFSILRAIASMRQLRALKRLTNVVASKTHRDDHAESLLRPGLFAHARAFISHTLIWAILSGIWQFQPWTEAILGPIGWGN